MNYTDLLIEAINSRKPISFEYNKPFADVGVYKHSQAHCRTIIRRRLASRQRR